PTSRAPSLPFTARPTPQITTLSLRDALPICLLRRIRVRDRGERADQADDRAEEPQERRDVRERREIMRALLEARHDLHQAFLHRSEEHTSELQSREKLVCRLLLEKKKRSHAG